MPSLDSFITQNFDALTFGLFFGCLFVLGGLEIFLERNPGAAHRKGRWPANIWLTGLNLVVLSVLPITGLTAAQLAQTADFGLLNQFELPLALLLIAGFLARSLVSYFIHLAMHKVPFLWRVHRIHHSDTNLDVSTTVRFHPLEFVLSVPLVFAVIWLMGLPPLVVMLYELFDAVMAVVSHANIRLPASSERLLQLLLVTPAMHRVHHSSHQPETDSNYGATLSLWDRMFRTYTILPEVELERMELGLRECQDPRPASFLWLMSLPFRRLHREETSVRSKVEPPAPERTA